MSRAEKVRSNYEESPLDAQPFLIARYLEESSEESSDRTVAWHWTVVRFCERVAAATLLLLMLPVISVAALIVFLLSGANPIIAHGRVGLGGKPFWVLKLRTMWRAGSPGRGAKGHFAIERILDHRGPASKRQIDPRVTSRFAAFCRRFSIDEAPQLWHVVRGEMALIGPRPLTEGELIEHYGAAAREVLRLRPGLTGLWQVKGRNRLTYRQRLRLDLFLVRKWSIGLYINILLATVPKVLSGKDAW